MRFLDHGKRPHEHVKAAEALKVPIHECDRGYGSIDGDTAYPVGNGRIRAMVVSILRAPRAIDDPEIQEEGCWPDDG